MYSLMEAKDRGRIALAGATALVGLAAVAILWAGPAQAQTEPYGGESPTTEPSVLNDRLTNDTPADDVGGRVLERAPGSGQLPFTGADLALYTVTGLAAVGTGSLIVRRAHGG